METTIASVFKAYDIRGLAPEQLDSAFALKLGKALAAHFGPKRVLVGRDMRTTSFSLESALIEGLTSSGVEVVRIGLCSTPMFYVLTGMAQEGSDVPRTAYLVPGKDSESVPNEVRGTQHAVRFDLAVMVTASHNPGKYNGFKIIRGNCLPVGQGSGMEELRDAFLAGKEVNADHQGSVSDDPDALERYIDKVLSLAELPTSMPNMKVAIDAGNGMAGAILPRLLAKLPWLEVLPLYFEPDGTFPNHEANPLKVETLNELIVKVKAENCVMGVAFDGDADRVGFVDELGEPIPGDLMTAFLAQEILKDNPGGRVLLDIRSSWAAQEAVTEAGGTFELCRVGHALIKKQMRETGAVFAGEVSMHIYFHDLWNVECSDLAMLLLLRRISSQGKPLSELMRPLKRYANSGEMNFEIQDKATAITRLDERYRSNASYRSDLDGLRLEFRDEKNPSNDWWFSVRASNTEPLLRLVVEARTPELLIAKTGELREEILKTE